MEQSVRLRPVTEEDLPILYRQQNDPQATRMAVFGVPDPSDEAAFMARWREILKGDPAVARLIEYEGTVAGNIRRFSYLDKPTIGYLIDRALWGKGIASEAVRQFVAATEIRPLYARVAGTNGASRRVLEKAGFRIVAEEQTFSNYLQEAVAEYKLRLDA